MTQGPPIPSYIFRGHKSAVHVLHFFAEDALLASGDSEGWLVIWSLSTKRPVAVWKAHDGGIMGLKDWQTERLITHGRDHKLRVWQLRPGDFEGLDIKLPVDIADGEELKQPWLLHSLSINALNYCSFGICEDDLIGQTTDEQAFKPLLLAAPNGLDAGGIDVFQLPREHRVCKLQSAKAIQTGMVMAVSIFRHPSTKKLTMASGYESGHVLLHINHDGSEGRWNWIRVTTAQPHTQPVLSVDVTPNGLYIFSSSADATIAKLSVESGNLEKSVDSKHAGQQDLKIRDDGKIFATAGWDKRVRVYSTKTVKELAVLKWHQEGCYATAFASTAPHTNRPTGQDSTSLVRSSTNDLQIGQARKTQSVHWLAAAGKDGKISLWDIY